MRRATAFFRARAALLWERAAPVLIGPAALLGLYLALALFGVFERLGDPWRLISLALTLGGAAAFIRWRLPAFSWPNQTEIERRIEDDSGLTDRPFEAMRDVPASGDPALWDAHIARMKVRLEHAHARRPKAAWGRLDPYGLRASVMLVLLTGAFLSGELAGPRLSDAFAPRLLAGGGQDARVDLWVEAPDYTNRPALFLRDRRSAEIPEGSVLFARIAGLNRAPSISGAPSSTETLSDGVQLARIEPQSDGVISLRAGRLRETVDLTLIEDTPPHLTFAAEPEGDAQGRLKLEFVAEDDYGLETIYLEYAQATGSDGATASDFKRYEISPGQIRPSDEDGFSLAEIDLSRDPLAGERVVIRLAGVDGAGQRGQSGDMTITLPQRVFLDPLARSVASERRRFLQVSNDYAAMPDGPPRNTGFLDDQPRRRLERAPDEVQRLALALNAASDAPPRYFDDPIVWMGLRTALMEVRRARELGELDHMESDLWEIALRAELGSLADAEAALAAAERALADALARGADQIEISALLDAFEQAMDRYMQLLMREAAEAGRFAEGGGGGMSADMLEQLLEALREATELGDTQGSRQALAMLAELLRNMQVTLGQGDGDGEGESAAAQALREALEELSETITEQRGLMEDTFNAQRDGQQGQNGETGRDPLSDPLAPGEAEPGGGPEDDGAQSFERQDNGGGASLRDLAGPQEDLPGSLDDVDDSLSGGEAGEEARQALDDARRAMEDAARALREGDGEDALARQDEALAGLRSAAQSAAQALEEELRQGEDGEGSDPLGRGAAEGQDTNLPSESERQRARDILEELRRRAAERGRPQEELDYIDRLLERF